MAKAEESKKDKSAHHVLLYVQTAEDVSILQDILAGIGAEGVVCTDLGDLRRQTAQDTDAVLLTEQSIVDGALPVLAEALESQPEWSDLPVLFVAAGGAESPLAVQAMQELRNVVVLDRPVRIATLAGVLRMASRVRGKQRQVRDLLEERQRRELNLHELKDRAEGLAWVNEWLARFPCENPDPVLRVSADSVMLYHNPGAEGLCRWWGCHDGQRVPPDMQEIISAALASNKVMQHEVSFDSRTYWLTISPFVADGYVNIYGRNITERKQAEEALRESELRYHRLFADDLTGDFLCTPEGQVLICNPAFARIFGFFSVEEAVGTSMLELYVDPRERQPLLETLRQQGKIEAFGASRKRRDGQPIHIVENLVGYFNDRGELFEVQGYVVDDTERRRAEEALRERMKELGCLYAVSRDIQEDLSTDELCRRAVEHLVPAMQFPEVAVPVIELKGKRFTSKNYAEGLSHGLHARIRVEGEVLGHLRVYYAEEKPFLIPEEQNLVNGVAEALSTWLERNQAEANQALLMDILRVLSRGGDLHPLIAEILRLIRQATGFDAVGLRLRQGEDCPYFEADGFSQEFLREENFLCARAGDGAIIRDAAGRPILECTCGLVLSGQTDPNMSCFTRGGSFWSNAASELLALAPEADPRTDPRNRCIHVGYQSVGLFPVRSGREIIGVLQLNDRRAGRFSPEQVAFYESAAQNMGLALQRTLAEEALHELNATLESKVAERTQELEHRARQLQKLTLELSETEDRERKRLADILHDDLQQQLAAAKFHLGLVGNQVKEDASLREATARVSEMIKGAIATSRSLSHELSPAMLYHGDFGETLEWLANQVQAKHGLVVHVEVRGRVEVSSDPIKAFLFRTAQEILFNTVKHAGVTEAAIRLRRRNGQVRLTVCDRGRGFDLKTLGQAAGFGLLSIRERVELLGGHMKIRSTPGRGSTFLIAVPDAQVSPRAGLVAEQAISEVVDKAAGRENGTCLRVLLADDHKVVREGLAILLNEQEDIEVVGQATNGWEAVDLAHKLQPDVVVMDVSMPVMEGDEATRQIKRRLPQTRVVALSMHDEARVMDRMCEAGASAYLLKTAPSEELLAAIRGPKENGIQ